MIAIKNLAIKNCLDFFKVILWKYSTILLFNMKHFYSGAYLPVIIATITFSFFTPYCHCGMHYVI